MKSIANLLRLDGRVALVVGGAGHIGGAALETLTELGAMVAVVDVDAAACTRTKDALVAGGAAVDDVEVVNCDLADETSTRRAVSDVRERFGRLDIVIHAAAFVGTTRFAGWAVPFADQSAAAFDAALRVNLTSAFVVCQAAAAPLAEHGNGAIVLVSSIYGGVAPDHRLYEGTPMANPLGYGASKAGLQQLARALSTTLAPKVRANCVSPGGVWRNQPASFVERYEARTPLQRMAVEEDLKGAFAYLCSDLSAYVTGQNLVVDGGWTAW